jgi:CheY-like chemotaxis protein
MEAIGNLTGGMAHDFNNMLGIILVNLEMLRKAIDAETMAAELCDEALDGANRCANMVRRLLAFARRQPLHPELTDVNAWIKDVTTLLGRTLGEDITLVLRLEERLWPVMVDPVQFEATLINFANNARDAMPGGGELTVTTRNTEIDEVYLAMHPDAAAGDYVLVEVSDTGTGIPPEIIGHIFEPFFTTKAMGAGTGLGLSMAFGFAKQSGGHLSVYSEPGLGTTFRLYLPRCTVPGEKASLPAALPAATGGHEIVLAVEDNAQLRRAMVRQLSELGYVVREADRAASAMMILRKGEPIDLLFTDVVMPGKMDGLELAYQAVRLRPNLKVLLASGFPGMRGNEHRTANNPFPLLSKPYNREQVARAIRAVLDKSGAQTIEPADTCLHSEKSETV